MKPAHALTALALVLGCAGIAGQATAHESTDEADLVRLLLAEAGPHRVADHRAILGVLERRALRVGSTAADVGRRYSPVFGRPTGFWGRTVRHASMRELEAVAPHVVALVRGWTRGEREPDPCPGSTHWGAPTGGDLERATRAGWLRVRCHEPTANAFWRER